MYEALHQLKFSSREKPFEAGEQISYEDFCKEIPDLRRRERIISQLIDQRRIITVSGIQQLEPHSQETQKPELEYVPVGRYRLPNGELVRGKDNALAHLKELEGECQS